ncbi:MAG: AbrB/MazE/SpoVT family DNA-binding domain-containing protein [Candidatus Hermodarchaeota archaeon]
MERVFRKLQKISGSFFVSLPKKWVENFNLGSKSPVAINVHSDGSLTISPKHEQEDLGLKEELTLHSSPFISREIVKHCLSGQTNIVVISDKEIDKELRSEIRWLVNGLPNTEIIEEQQQRVVIQNFGYKKIPTKKLIQRLLYLVADMLENLIEDRIDDLKYNFDQLRKFYFILVTHIRTYLRTGIYVSEDTDFTPLEAMDYRMFCEKIEEIGKILRNMQVNEKVKEFFLEINKYFNDVMNAYLKKDFVLAHKAWLKKDKLVERAFSLLDKLNYEDKDKVKNMIRIAEKCKDMAAFI